MAKRLTKAAVERIAAGEPDDPVGIISANCEQSCYGLQFRPENRAETAVACLTGSGARAQWRTMDSRG